MTNLKNWIYFVIYKPIRDALAANKCVNKCCVKATEVFTTIMGVVLGIVIMGVFAGYAFSAVSAMWVFFVELPSRLIVAFSSVSGLSDFFEPLLNFVKVTLIVAFCERVFKWVIAEVPLEKDGEAVK